MKEKLKEIDILRGLAFLAVVLQHAIGHYYPLPETGLADGVLLGAALIASKFAVPVFLFITGMVLFYNYSHTVHAGTFLWKRARDVVFPYAVWTVVYVVLIHKLDLGAWATYRTLGRWLITGEACYHLWYVVMILQFYLLFPLLQRGLTVLAGRPAGAAATVLVSGGVYLWLMSQKGPLFQSAAALDMPFVTAFFTTYMDRNAIMFFLYFVFGAAAGLHMELWRKLLVRYASWIIAASVLMSAWLMYRMVAQFQLTPKLGINFSETALLQPFMTLFLIVSVFASHGFALVVWHFAGSRMNGLLTWIGARSYTAYLAHALVLHYAVRWADWFGGTVILRNMLLFVIVSILSVAVAEALHRLLSMGKARRRSPSQASLHG